jgi:demethylmenaquinone methyltransferase/2-methoxy-6-polyprenyl-1,4-benzoquinol methylase
MISRSRYKWFYDNVQSRYYDLLMKYCFLPFGGETNCRSNLLASVVFHPADRILDMCCGTGGSTIAIADRASRDSEIIGIDLSSGQIAAAMRRPAPRNVKFFEGDANHTGFRDEQFDKVVIAHALHEMPMDLRLSVLAEAKRVLKHGGMLIVLEVDNPENLLVRILVGLWLFYWLPFNFETPTRREMIRRGLVNEISEVGFTGIIRETKRRGAFQVVTATRL